MPVEGAIGVVEGLAAPGLALGLPAVPAPRSPAVPVPEAPLPPLPVELLGAVLASVPPVPDGLVPDVPVPLGSYRVSELGGVGNGTPWKEFDIQLLNCPAFHGYFSTTGPQWSNDGSTLPGTRTNNAVNFRLDPVNGVIDAANGVMSLTNSAPGEAPAATGVGIQIARRTAVPVPLGTMVAGFQARSRS